MPHDAELVFRKQTDGLWEELVRRSGRGAVAARWIQL
jgi:hypothetical protein